MSSLGQIIFCSMIVVIILAATLIILILSFALSDSSSNVLSLNTFPVANISRDVRLSCYLNRDAIASVSRVSLTWEKVGLGLVYAYRDGAPALADQDPQFTGRVQVSAEDLVAGNASLLLADVRRGDGGVYRCSIGSSGGRGDVDVNLRTAGFSAATFTLEGDALTAVANRWFPKPNATWLDEADGVLEASTNLTEDSQGFFRVVSTLQTVNASDVYAFRVENGLVVARARAALEGRFAGYGEHHLRLQRGSAPPEVLHLPDLPDLYDRASLPPSSLRGFLLVRRLSEVSNFPRSLNATYFSQGKLSGGILISSAELTYFRVPVYSDVNGRPPGHRAEARACYFRQVFVDFLRLWKKK
ncbi:V-set domain-containing T-cell activation inhibitor 1 [Brachionichthys hirsutus]|uniref:V-set domain-containing T-cell activation inhibitor 1 n=1 Tax=Brachionichthys hirsutus TaxID=412623 RepID=UPI00360502E4